MSKMENVASTLKDYRTNSAEVNSHLSIENDNDDISISVDRLEKENSTDGFPLTMDGLLSFPLLKKKKKKFPFPQHTSVEQIESFKNEEFHSSSNLHFSEEQLNVDNELKIVPFKNRHNKYENSNILDESHVFDELSEMPLHSNAIKELDDLDVDMNFEGAKKKKKKSTKQAFTTDDDDDDISESRFLEKKMPVAERLFYSSNSDYTYDYLLARFYSIAIQERPAMEMTSVMKLTIKPPLIFRVGSKKTSFANFIEICRILHRPPQHLMSFLLIELGTSGSLDGNNHLIIKGRFQQKQIENIIRRYIKEYVRCFTCSSLNTVMQKEIRLTFLMCENCESRRSVASIKSGFQALTGKRAAIRAKIS